MLEYNLFYSSYLINRCIRNGWRSRDSTADSRSAAVSNSSLMKPRLVLRQSAEAEVQNMPGKKTRSKRHQLYKNRKRLTGERLGRCLRGTRWTCTQDMKQITHWTGRGDLDACETKTRQETLRWLWPGAECFSEIPFLWIIHFLNTLWECPYIFSHKSESRGELWLRHLDPRISVMIRSDRGQRSHLSCPREHNINIGNAWREYLTACTSEEQKLLCVLSLIR